MLTTLQNTLLAVCNSLPFMVWIKESTSLTYVFVNSVWEKNCGVTWDIAMGKDDVKLFGPEGVQYKRADREVILGGVPRTFKEFTVGLKEQKWVRTTKIPVRDAEGNIVAIVGVAQDFTEDLMFQNLLELQIERLEALQDNVA